MKINAYIQLKAGTFLIPFCILTLNFSYVKGQNSIPVLVIHGGAGTIQKSALTPELEAAYKHTLDSALSKGYAILQNGGLAVDAVQAAVNVLENSYLFNAGRGSVLNAEGKVEMDASIMDGSNLNCGAVAGVHVIKNPIDAARLVMDSSQHVLLTGQGAELFCQKYHLETKPEKYFITEKRSEQLQRAKERNAIKLDHDLEKKSKDTSSRSYIEPNWEDTKFGTVGAVAIDTKGNLAAATSTGGLTNKMYGRIGDSPVIGAGTYANKTAAVSCTGHGEYFIKNAVAYDVIAMMEYKQITLQEACEEIVQNKLKSQDADGGLIAIDKSGNFVMEFNTKGMFRAVITPKTKLISIYKEE